MMMKIQFKVILILVSVWLMHTNIWSQNSPKSLIVVKNGDFIAQMENEFYVVAQQNQKVTKNQIDATQKLGNGSITILEIFEENGYFKIHPDSLGLIEFTVKLKDTTEKKIFLVKPITAVARLSGFKANDEVKISPGDFKAQRGLYAVVECCGFDAKCEILNYEVIRITTTNKVERNKNVGGAFQPNTKTIIDRTSTGDLYVFRKIYCKCQTKMKSLRLEDMTFEIE